jgi:hypothetical protein
MKIKKLKIARNGAVWGLLAVLAFAMAPVGVAQAQSTTSAQVKDAERQLKQIENQRRTGAASGLVSPGDDKISFADVLKDPDNVDLNFRYAKAQLARGDVRGAAGTLERILLVTPDLPSVRLVYAIVLFRLDSMDESEREFRALSKVKLSPELRAQVDKFLSEIVQRRQRTRYKVQMTIGAQYDTNRNSAPRGNRIEVGGVQFTVLGRSRKQDDIALLAAVTGEVVQDLGLQAPHEFVASATYFHDEQMSIDQQDTQVASLSFGPRLRFRNLTVTPKLSYTRLALSREKLYSSQKGEVLLETKNLLPWGSVDGYFKAGYTSEEFRVTKENRAADNLDGHRYEANAGVKFKLDSANLMNLDAGYFRKTAFGNSDEYRGFKVGMTHTWLIGQGAFLVSSAEFNKSQYRANSAAAFKLRHERGTRFRSTYGRPVGSFVEEAAFGEGVGAKVYDFVKDVTWTATGEIYDQQSNIINFDFLNFKAQTMLTKVWKF